MVVAVVIYYHYVRFWAQKPTFFVLFCSYLLLIYEHNSLNLDYEQSHYIVPEALERRSKAAGTSFLRLWNT